MAIPANHGPLLAPGSALRSWIGAMACALPGLAALAAFAATHLPSMAFWYDESMQFWISLGIDGFGPPLVPQGSLKDMIRINGVTNLDPGGFTLILRYWLWLGTGELWQRVLPFLFFVVGIAGLGWIGWSHRKSMLFAVACCAVPALFPLILDYATEVRAYSMEFSGIVIGCALVDRLATRPSPRMALGAGVVFGFFLSARYSYLLFVMAACLTLAREWLASGEDMKPADRWRALAFVGPILSSGLLISVLALWPQYRARISYHSGELVQYLYPQQAIGKSAGEIGAMLAVNLLNPAGLPLTLAALAGLIAVLPRSVRARVRIDGLGTRLERSGLARFGLLCLASLVLVALLWRWHPWNITTKWSLWLQALSAVAVVKLFAVLLGYVEQADAINRRRTQLLTVATLAAMLALDVRLALNRRDNWTTFVPALAYVERLSAPADSVAVDVHAYPTVRYFYEYGFLASSRLFPTTFRLSYRDSPKPLITERTQLLITNADIATANRVHAPARIVQDPDLPDLMFRVEPAAPGSHR